MTSKQYLKEEREIKELNMSTLEKPEKIVHSTINREKMLSYLIKLVVWLQPHLWLVLLGITSELVYFFYLLHDFPVISHSLELTDMGAISGFSHLGFLKFLVALSFLFILFGFAWWDVRRFQDRATLWTILGFGGVFALTTIFVYPVTAIDIFNYIGYSLIMLQHSANPMTALPSQFIADPVIRVVSQPFINVPSPYGPLAQVIQALPVVIGGRNVLASLLLTKFMFSTVLIFGAFFVYKILSHIAPRFALPGTLALAWNPFVLLEYSANSHNDIVMMFFIILAVFALIKKHHVLALTLITASALIKFASLPLIPLFFFYSFIHQPTWKEKILYTLESSVASLSLLLATFIPFWAGSQTLQRFLNETQGQLYSFSMFLQDLSSEMISSHQATQVGWALFVICFFYALWLCLRDISHMLQGCAITMFALLAFSATYIQPWYLIWPFVLAILIPQTEVSLAAILLLYAATLVELVHAYIFPWGAYNDQSAFSIVNSVVYFIMFFPPMLFLLVSRFRHIFSQPPSSLEDDIFDPLSP